MSRPNPSREALWAEVERELRCYVRLFGGEHEWLWEAAEVTFVRAVRPHLEALDAADDVAPGLPAQGRPLGGGG